MFFPILKGMRREFIRDLLLTACLLVTVAVLYVASKVSAREVVEARAADSAVHGAFEILDQRGETGHTGG